MSISIQGLQQLGRALRDVEESLNAGFLRHALLDAAEPVVDEAKRLAPVSATAPSRGTKHLRDAIAADSVRASATMAEVKVGFEADQYHGIFVELGTLHQSPRPFLRPALDAARDDVIGILTRELGTKIHKARRSRNMKLVRASEARVR